MATDSEKPTPPLREMTALKNRPEVPIAAVLPFFDDLDAWVCISDLETNTILYANPYIQELFGDVTGQVCWQALQHGMTAPCSDCSNHCLFDGDGKPTRLVTHECCNSVNGRWYSCNSQGVHWTDGRRARLEISTDITHRKVIELEAAHATAARLDARRLASLEFLAGGVAHDFNNLLMGVLGHAELALMKPQDSANVRHHLAKIGATARRATGLTEKLLAFSGNGQLHMEPVDPSQVIGTIVADTRRHVPPMIQLTTSLAEDLPPVRADRRQIQMAVGAAIHNAIEAISGEPGSIRISTRLETIDHTCHEALCLRRPLPSSAHVVIAIEDDGPGVPKTIACDVYDPFVSTRGPGRGLGLAAVDGILRSHQGSAGLISTPGEGTTVFMVLPVYAEADQTASGQRQTLSDDSAHAAPQTVLLVEDDATVREATSAMLGILGLTVIGAQNGREALEILNRAGDQVNLVLTDYLMPEMDGIETLEAMRATHPDLPILLSSGFPRQDVVGRLGTINHQGFIKKPYRFADLKEAVVPLLNL